MNNLIIITFWNFEEFKNQILSIGGQHEKFQLSLSVYHHIKNGINIKIYKVNNNNKFCFLNDLLHLILSDGDACGCFSWGNQLAFRFISSSNKINIFRHLFYLKR